MNALIKHWPSQRAHRWAESFVQALPEQPGIAAVLAIGSSVRDIRGRKSDVDLVVIYRGTKPKNLAPPIDVDIRFFDVLKVEKLISEGHDLLGWAVRFGRTIHDPSGFWGSIDDRWKSSVPFPAPAASLERAHKAQRWGRELLALGDEDAAREQQLTMLTHLARARLLLAKVYPASRPELPDQLRAIGEMGLAEKLSDALEQKGPIEFEID